MLVKLATKLYEVLKVCRRKSGFGYQYKLMTHASFIFYSQRKRAQKYQLCLFTIYFGIEFKKIYQPVSTSEKSTCVLIRMRIKLSSSSLRNNSTPLFEVKILHIDLTYIEFEIFFLSDNEFTIQNLIKKFMHHRLHKKNQLFK